MKNLTWQNPEQLFVAQELINKVKSKCCGIKVLLVFHPVAGNGAQAQIEVVLPARSFENTASLLVFYEVNLNIVGEAFLAFMTDNIGFPNLAGSVQDKNLIGAILQIISDFRLDLSSKHTLFRYNSYRKFTLFSKNAQLKYTLFSRTLCTSVPDLYQTRKVDNFSFPIFSWQSILQDSLLEPGSLHKTGTVLPS